MLDIEYANMYDLFELKKIITLVKSNGNSGATIELSAYSECSGRSILALVCDNGYLLFYYLKKSAIQPVIRQLNWFSGPGKTIKALSFDPSGTWLLLVTFDASVYILPVLPLMDSSVNFTQHWKSDNITEIKLAGQRASLTSVRWWQTLQGQDIAVIGSELGEIAFVNLINKKEVGGTYITVGISALDILKDEGHDTTYLLITGFNRQQWRLLLEEKRTNFYWPFNSEIEVISCEDGNGLSLIENATGKDEKDGEQKPHKLSKFESGTFLTPQIGVKRSLVSAYNASSNMLQVLEGDLDQMHLFSYQVPSDCENVILSDKLIFITQTCRLNNGKFKSCLRLLSRKFSEICLENSKRKEHQSSEVQTFCLEDKVTAIYKRSFEYCKILNFQDTSISSFMPDTPSNVSTTETVSSFDTSLAYSSENTSLSSSANYESDNEQEDNNITKKIQGIESLFDVTSLDGCYLVLKDAVWECRLRVPPEILFLSLTSASSDLLMAEKLGIMLSLDIHKLYEVAAEIQLSQGQFALAVHLYHLSKCPQLKRIAHFMSYGYLSELIAYIQVLFSTKSVEIVPADKCHFANIALHCFAQQAMEKVNEQKAISIAFKKFLRENVYYDEAVVTIKLFAEQGLFDLLYYFSEVRGLHGLIVDTLLNTVGLLDALESDAFAALGRSGFNNLTSHLNYEDYLLCITSPNLIQYLAANPKLLSQHIQHLIKLLPSMNIHHLTKVAALFDLSHPFARLAIRNMASSKWRHKYWSTGSMSLSSNLKVDPNENEGQFANEEDFIKFFVFVLLMLCHKWKTHHFDMNLVSTDLPTIEHRMKQPLENSTSLLTIQFMPLSCGMAHVSYCHNNVLLTWGKTANGRLGNGDDISIEFENPSSVNIFVNLQVKVLSVSCGATHTMALTDFGVFSWGSSRYGQLGLGDIQRSAHPVIIEALSNQQIVSLLCGQYHSLALTEYGRVYSWGWGIHGQLGHGNPEDVNVPKIIDYLKMKTIISLGAGQGHSILLTNDGDVYSFGCGMFGQLGIGSILKHSLPQLVSLPEKIVLMSSGYFHTVAVSKTNNIYLWGCNPQALRLQAQCSRRSRQNNSYQNQSASLHSQNQHVSSDSTVTSTRTSHLNSHMQTHLSPTIVDSSDVHSPIIHISCGSHHSVLLTNSGELYSWGRNMEGQIGNGSRREQKIPGLVADLSPEKIIYAACGADFTIAVNSTGKIFGWGKNDYGQVGQKAPETTVKATSGSSSGRVITIRTNRRMITITQPCRQSLLRPIEIILPQNDLNFYDLDSSSFESEYAPLTRLQDRTSSGSQSIPCLALYDDPSYGPYALHATLKAFYSFCDATSILKHCLSFTNFQAAAKVCLLQNNHAEAINYQFMAITSDTKLENKDFLPLALYVVEIFSRCLEVENTESNKLFLYYVIKFWVNNDLPVQPLEMLLQTYFYIYSYPLCLLLFKDASWETANTIDTFLSQVSKNFCVNIVSTVLNRICDSTYDSEILEKLTFRDFISSFPQIYGSDILTSWNDSVPSELLWHEITHNIQKGLLSYCNLSLSISDVDALAKSLITQKLCFHQKHVLSRDEHEENIASDKDTIAFSCSHYYTLQTFRTSILPSFKDSLSRLPYVLPSTMKYLLNCYHLPELIPNACPKCVLNEIKSECSL